MENVTWFAVEKPREEGKIEKVFVGGKKVCLVFLEGTLYATSSRCPHAGADLALGWCEERKLVCSYHRHRFDLQTGRGDAGQGDYIDVFPVKEENDRWYIGIKKSWWARLF